MLSYDFGFGCEYVFGGGEQLHLVLLFNVYECFV